MQNEREMPRVPGLARLTWILFMQPFKLHELYQAWGLNSNSSLVRLWPRMKARDPVVLALLRRCAMLHFVVMPMFTGTVALFFHVLGYHVDPSGVAAGVLVGILAGVLAGVAEGGVAASVALGVVLGVAFGVPRNVAGGIAVGIMGIAGGVAGGVARDLVFGVARGVAGGVARGIAYGAALSMTTGLMFGVLVDPVYGVAVGMSCTVMVFRLPFYILEAAFTFLLGKLIRVFPREASRLASWLPHRHHDLIYFPLPGFQSFITQVGEEDPDLAWTLIAEAGVSTGQQGVARRTLIELQSLTLSKAVQNRTFARIANLDLPFLTRAGTLDPDSPLRTFQLVAEDLCVDGGDHRRRHLALDNARNTLNGAIDRALQPTADGLAKRLLSVAKQWLDIVDDEQAKLDRAEEENPQVPRAFLAGLPLDPNRPEQRGLFKGRTDLGRIVNHHLGADRQGILVIVGQRRMGKSSFRNFLTPLLGSAAEIVVADFQMLSGNKHRSNPHCWILELIAKRCANAPAPPDSSAWSEALDWLVERDAEIKRRRMLVVIDEVESVERGIREKWCSTDFLDFLRACGDKLRHIRIVLLTAHRLPRLGSHWNGCLMSATSCSISYLDSDMAEELLRKPMVGFPDIYSKSGVAQILQATHRHPFLVQKVGDELCEHLNANHRLKANEDDIIEVLDRVAREPLFDELWDQRTPEERTALHQLACAKEALEANATMRTLAADGYVELDADEKPTITVPLFAQWIRRSQGRLPSP